MRAFLLILTLGVLIPPAAAQWERVDNFGVEGTVNVIANAWGCFNDNTGVYRQPYTAPSAHEPTQPVASLTMDAPFPNPSGDEATVAVTMREPGVVRLSVVDVLGHKVAVVYEGTLGTGRHALSVPAPPLSRGLHTMHLSQGKTKLLRTFTGIH